MGGKGAGPNQTFSGNPASSSEFNMISEAVPSDPINISPHVGVEFAAPLPDSSSNSYACHSGLVCQPIFSAQSSMQCEGVAQFSHTQVFTEQSSRDRKRRERHQHRMVQKQNEASAKKRRMLWNKPGGTHALLS